MSAIKSYTDYLLKRFQIIPLSVLVLSDVLVIGRIADVTSNGWWVQATVFFMVLAYLFNNRVGDDKRDFAFDALHYPDRAVQQGTIGLKQLEFLGTLTMMAMVGLAWLLGMTSFLLVIPVWLFGWWAKKDFSLPVWFKEKYFFLYNFLNMLQMLVLQVFIYLSLIDSFDLTPLIWLHVAFVFALSLQVEVTRKIKVQPTTANDMYSDRMGMPWALTLWMLLGAICVLLSSMLAVQMSIELSVVWISATCWMLIMLAGAMYYLKKRVSSAENVFWLAMIVSYVGQNLVLAYA